MGWHELRVGLIMGIAFAIILGMYAFFADGENRLDFALAIATAIVATVTVAATFGLMVPMTLHRLSVDPAIATGPFVTTGIDIVAILIYFWTCSLMLPT
jgi:magnesium transporter